MSVLEYDPELSRQENAALDEAYHARKRDEDVRTTKCSCGMTVTLDRYNENECRRCGALYFSSGGRMTPRWTWDEARAAVEEGRMECEQCARDEWHKQARGFTREQWRDHQHRTRFEEFARHYSARTYEDDNYVYDFFLGRLKKPQYRRQIEFLEETARLMGRNLVDDSRVIVLAMMTGWLPSKEAEAKRLNRSWAPHCALYTVGGLYFTYEDKRRDWDLPRNTCEWEDHLPG